MSEKLGIARSKKALLLSVSLLLVVALLLFTAVSCVPKKSSSASATTTTSPTKAIEQRLKALETSVDNSNRNTVSQSDLNAINDELNTLDSSVDNLDTEYAELRNTISRLEDEIEELKEEQDEEIDDIDDMEDTDPEDAVEVDLTYASVVNINAIAPGAVSSQTMQVKLKAENTLPVDIEDVEFSIVIRSIDIAGPNTGHISVVPTKITGDISFYGAGNSYDSWDDIDLKADERESYLLTLTMSFTNGTDEPISPNVNTLYLTVKSECTDFSVVR